MITLLQNARVFTKGGFHKLDVLLANNRIEAVGEKLEVPKGPFELEVLDCADLLVAPGLIDPHQHMAGGSGEEGGYFSQSPQVLISECIDAGIVTVVGTLGADTVTLNMPALLAKVKAFKEMGLSAYAYTGGYDVPCQTMTGTVKSDIMLIDELIGVGELAISDERAPEPSTRDLAGASVDAYVAGMLTGKAGVTHFHVGSGKKRLKAVRDLVEQHTIKNDHLYMTHIERSKELVQEGIELAKQGSYVDFDIHEEDLHKWYTYYLEHGGPKSQLTVSSDADSVSPRLVWNQIQECVLKYRIPIEDLLPHFTENPARVLKLKKKGRIEVGMDADFAMFHAKDLDLVHVMAQGKFFMKNGKHSYKNNTNLPTRDVDAYEIHKEKGH